jgi:hypothetical protein
VDPLIGLRTLAAPPAGLLRVATDHSASTLTPGDRARLLADLRSNKGPTRILVEATVFDQGVGHNRNYVRFRPGVLRHLAASFRGVPFLRDHAQQDRAARGGTVLDRRKAILERLDDLRRREREAAARAGRAANGG